MKINKKKYIHIEEGMKDSHDNNVHEYSFLDELPYIYIYIYIYIYTQLLGTSRMRRKVYL